MKAGKLELIKAELQRAEEAYAIARFASEAHFWNSLAGELYYTCFHLIQAIFVERGLQAYTHTGAKAMFSLHFIKEGEIDEKWGKLLAALFRYRQQGNYGD